MVETRTLYYYLRQPGKASRGFRPEQSVQLVSTYRGGAILVVAKQGGIDNA
jgi:hypothetical protein